MYIGRLVGQSFSMPRFSVKTIGSNWSFVVTNCIYNVVNIVSGESNLVSEIYPG